jgi:hypothetical protein
MSYIVITISFGIWIMEYQVTEDFILRKTMPSSSAISPELLLPITLLDQRNGNLYTVDPENNYRVETQYKYYDTGWQSDHYDLKQISTNPCSENGWPCVEITESKITGDKTPFGSGDEFQTISRICKIPALENLIKDEKYYKFLGFYRTDIDLPFRGLLTKQWIKSAVASENIDFENTTSELKEIKEVSGISFEIEAILKLPIETR